MRIVSPCLLGFLIFGFGAACSAVDPEDDATATGGASSGESGGAAGSGGGGITGGSSSSDGGTTASGGQASEFSEVYERMAGLCGTGRYIRASLNLEDTEDTQDGLGLIASSGTDSVEGDKRNLFFTTRQGYDFYFSWSSSAAEGTEVDASGVLLSSDDSAYNHCFTGKAIVGREINGEIFHLVASNNLTLADADGTCTDTPAAGDVAFCIPDGF